MWGGGECFRGQLLVSVGPLIRKPINEKKTAPTPSAGSTSALLGRRPREARFRS